MTVEPGLPLGPLPSGSASASPVATDPTAAVGVSPPPLPGRRPKVAQSLWSDAFRRLRRSNSARIGLAIVLFFIAVGLFAVWLAPYPPTAGEVTQRLQPPSLAHPFGLDANGRDVLSRVIYGSAVSLQVGIFAVGGALLLGTLIGLVAGYVRGWTDWGLMRFMEVILAFPSTLLAVAIVAARGQGLQNTILAVSVVSIPVYARLARSTVLALREREFVTAARSVGASHGRLLFLHILPNSLSPLIVQGSLGIATAVLEAAALGFLGLGQPPPNAEWGVMLSDARANFETAPFLMFFPGLAIVLTVLGFNLLGDGLRDALDPRLRD